MHFTVRNLEKTDAGMVVRGEFSHFVVVTVPDSGPPKVGPETSLSGAIGAAVANALKLADPVWGRLEGQGIPVEWTPPPHVNPAPLVVAEPEALRARAVLSPADAAGTNTRRNSRPPAPRRPRPVRLPRQNQPR